MASSSGHKAKAEFSGGWLAPGMGDIDLSELERDPELRRDERQALRAWIDHPIHLEGIREAIPRIWAPLARVHDRQPPGAHGTKKGWQWILRHLYHENCTIWGVPEESWLADFTTNYSASQARPYVFCYAYVLRNYAFSSALVRHVSSTTSARLIFGGAAFDALYVQMEKSLVSLGYNLPSLRQALPTMLATLMLTTRTSDPAAYTEDVLRDLEAGGYGDSVRLNCGKVSRALSLLGYLPEPLRMRHYKRFKDRDTRGIAPEWVALAHQWRDTSTIGATTRQSGHGFILRIGLWLADKHPEVRRPRDWTPGIAAEAIAFVSNMKVGDYALPSAPPLPAHRLGQPLSFNSQCSVIMHLRRFFLDVEIWEWEKLRFNPRYHLATPTRILRQRGVNPRIVDERIWTKLIWASLNLQPEDVKRQRHYPFALVRAVGMVWTHAGLRENEIRRLRVGCSVPQLQEINAEHGESVPANTLTYLTVPPSKTAREFVKPVGFAVHEAIKAWMDERAVQPDLLDAKTGEQVQYLFAHRGKMIGQSFIDGTVIPALCEKAGVPREDSRGKITSHRARASIVTALANSPQGLSLPELMKWVGHRCSRSTMHYLAIRPTRLAATFAQADRTAHMIEVLLDHEAVVNGDAAAGRPYKFYDLGDSFCTNPFWSTCAHRMACARCDFNLPKDSSYAQALETRTSVQRLLETVPLSDDERAAAEGDRNAVDRFIGKLEDKVTLDGRTRREIEATSLVEREAMKPVLQRSLHPSK